MNFLSRKGKQSNGKRLNREESNRTDTNVGKQLSQAATDV
jgi:hypothetical protein